MGKVLCKGGTQRGRWAVSLCFASATLLSLEALRPGVCSWLHMGADQCFNLCAGLATGSIFMGTFVLTELLCGQSTTK